eukprot:3631593-Rhodomonas_salina.1
MLIYTNGRCNGIDGVCPFQFRSTIDSSLDPAQRSKAVNRTSSDSAKGIVLGWQHPHRADLTCKWQIASEIQTFPTPHASALSVAASRLRIMTVTAQYCTS